MSHLFKLVLKKNEICPSTVFLGCDKTGRIYKSKVKKRSTSVEYNFGKKKKNTTKQAADTLPFSM